MATTDKYDRQLRLWGAAGQRALGNTMVVLLGSSACGTETLKNLVLPGVGSFLVVDDGDDGVVSSADNGSTGAAATAVQSCPDLPPSLLQFGEQSSNFFLPSPTKGGGGEGGRSGEEDDGYGGGEGAVGGEDCRGAGGRAAVAGAGGVLEAGVFGEQQ